MQYTWEQRKLNEYLEESKIKNKDESFGKEDVLSVSGDSLDSVVKYY